MAQKRALLIGSLAVSLVLAVTGFSEASVLACKRSEETFCYLCVDGDLLDTCSTTCWVCTGFQCLPEGVEAAAAGGEPIAELIELPAVLLEEHLGTHFARILANVWQGYRSPGIERRAVVELGGGVLIGEGVESLTEHPLEVLIRQDDGVQLYEVRVQGYGEFELTVRPLGGEQTEVQYVLGLDGERRRRVGNILLPQALEAALPGS